MRKIKKVVLTPNPYRDKGFKTALAALQILEECGIEVRLCLPFEVDKTFDMPCNIRFYQLDKELPGADMLICFGGDGTILHASKAATKAGLPILGVNIGTMGFIAELESSELSMLRQIVTGEYTIERRRMLDVSVFRERAVLQKEVCLNDVVITKGAIARVIRLGVYCDDVCSMDFAGDGVIVATPTGSTAYSLSAGGPIVEPEAQVMLITPICAHDTQTRCIVASDQRTISVRLNHTSKRNAFLSVDGGRALRLNTGDVVKITRSSLVTELVRMKSRSFYDVVGTKIHDA